MKSYRPMLLWSLIIIVIFTVKYQLIAQASAEDIFIENLITRMTLEEKIGQLVLWNGSNLEGEKRLRRGGIGAFLNIRNRDEITRLQKIAVEETPLGIPILIGNDVIHGYYTTFPIPLAFTSSWNPGLVKKAAQIAAVEARENGTHWTFAPMVDIARDPRWGRIAEGFGEDPFLGSVMAKAMVEGFQGTNFANRYFIAACAKHYVAYGAALAGKDYNTVDISGNTLREVYLPPFKAAVGAGVATLMSAFNDINGVPASANQFTLTRILRDEWEFDGFVVSDYNSIAELIYHRLVVDKSGAAAEAIQAGVDMDMVGDTTKGDVYSPNLEKLVKTGMISEKIISQSVRRILRIKYRLGLFEHPDTTITFMEPPPFSDEEKKEVALQLARESIVLLKNENKILPLRKDIKNLTVIGPLANNRYEMLGTWTCEPIVENVATILEGIREKVSSNTSITFVKGCDINSKNKIEFQKAIQAAKTADVVILVLGESISMSGEAASRTELGLPGVQQEMIEKIYAIGTPIVVVLINGRPLTINWISKNIPGILEAWHLGDQAGNAISEVIFGDYNPSGKLPVTFPRSVGQIPIYYSHKSTGRPFDPNDKYTTKYIDIPVTPLYPFGYGLSYTSFAYSNLTLNKNQICINEDVKVAVDVTNNGNREGVEIVQIYLRDQVAKITRPVKELKGFQKVQLKPGETRTIEFVISSETLAFYDNNMNNIVEAGSFDVMVGKDSEDVISASFELLE